MGIHDIQNISKGYVYYSNSTFLHFKKQRQHEKGNFHEMRLYDNFTDRVNVLDRDFDGNGQGQLLNRIVDELKFLRQHNCIDGLLFMTAKKTDSDHCNTKKVIDQLDGIYKLSNFKHSTSQ